MVKYQVLGITPDKSGIFEIQDDMSIVSGVYNPVTGEFNVVVIKRIEGPSPPGTSHNEFTLRSEGARGGK